MNGKPGSVLFIYLRTTRLHRVRFHLEVLLPALPIFRHAEYCVRTERDPPSNPAACPGRNKN
jgi:hypothetical protein